MNRNTCIALAALAATSPLYAQPLDTEDTVVVTATRTPLALEDVLAPVIVIDGDTVRRTATFDLAETLRLYAGIEIGRAGGPGQQTSLFVRGTNSNHVQVMIDGVRINPGTLGGAAIQHVNPADIERIEVVKGPRSTLYGTEAIGGVVNIITKRAEAPLALDAVAGVGSFGTRQAGGGIKVRDGDWSSGLRADHGSTDGFPPQAGATRDRGYDNLSLRAFGTWHGATASLEASHWQADGNVEYLDFFGAPVDQDFRNTASALTARFSLGASATTVRVTRATDEIDQTQSPDFAHTRRLTLEWQSDVPLAPTHDLTAGVASVSEDTEAEVFGSAFDEAPDSNAVFVQYAWAPAGERLLVAARHTDHDGFGTHTTWNLEYGYELTENWRVIAAAGTAFRAPDSTERFGFGGNAGLRPETVRNFELGLRGKLGDDKRIELQLYRNTIDDLILFDTTTFTLANLERARITGIEVAYVQDIGSVRWRQSATLADPENLTTGEPLPRRAERSAQTSLTWQATGDLELGADLVATGERKDSAFGPDFIDGYVLLNLSAAWTPAPGWSLEARVENATDADYETALGFPAADRAAFVRVRWHHVGANL